METKPNPEQIEAILRSSDHFGHELRVGALLRELQEASVLHGGTYSDPVEGKPRQFDYRVHIENGNQEIRLAVECKCFPEVSPVIISGVLRSPSESSHSLIVSEIDDTSTEPRAAFDTFTIKGEQSYYKIGEFVGKCLHRVKPTKGASPFELAGDGDVYGALNQSIASAFDLCQSATFCIQELSPWPLYTAVIPVVVLPDATLWTATYSADGRQLLPPEKRDYCTYYIGKRIKLRPNIAGGSKASLNISHMHIYTISGLREFIQNLSASATASHGSDDREQTIWSKLFPGIAINKINRETKTRLY